MSLFLARAFEPGTKLIVDVVGGAPAFASTVTVCVLQATSQPDGTWLIEAVFPPRIRRQSVSAMKDDQPPTSPGGPGPSDVLSCRLPDATEADGL